MNSSIAQFLADKGSLGVFLLVSVAMGGAAAWLSGRAIAAGWRPWWHVVGPMLVLAFAVRFIHFAVFDSKLLSLHYYLVDATVCLIAGLIGFRRMRARAMVASYGWIYERAGPLTWRPRGNAGASATGDQA